MFSSDRTELRGMFYAAWKMKRDGKVLDALQQMIVDVIEQHPEYHALLENPDGLDRDFSPALGETNPFLHMSLHIALVEQVSTDRPAGIRDCHQRLARALASTHEAEHRMMQCLSEAIWQAQRRNTVPDEAAYIECLRRMTENH